MGVSFSDLEAVLRMRDVIVKIVTETVDKIRPKYRYATVTAVDTSTGTATVTFPGDADPLTVRLGSGVPTSGQTVRIEGVTGDRFIADVMAAPSGVGSVSQMWEKEFSASGDLVVGTEPGARIFNSWSRNIVFTALYISVADAPTGDNIEVNLYLNDVAIFPTTFGMPTIVDGETWASYDLAGTISFLPGDNIRCEILNVGSTDPGKNLTVQVAGHTVG